MQEQEREIIAPASVPQELFINSDADITLTNIDLRQIIIVKRNG